MGGSIQEITMSELTLFKGGNLAIPDYLREPDAITKMLAGNGSGKQISIKGGVWRMIVGGEEVAKNEDRAMNLVVLGANPHVNRTYFAGKYVEGEVADPTCWSADGKTPDADVPATSRQGSSCDKCPQNIAGSGEGTSRACRYSRRLAVAIENDIEGNVYRLQLPAKSIFGKPDGDKMPLDAYAKFLSGHGVPITGVVTEARFNTAEAVPVLVFKAVRPLSREEWEQAKVAAASEDATRATEFKLVARTPKAAPQATSAEYQEPADPPVSKPAAEAAPAAPEPTKRTTKPKPAAAEPAPAAATSVADLLSQWGDDDD